MAIIYREMKRYEYVGEGDFDANEVEVKVERKVSRCASNNIYVIVLRSHPVRQWGGFVGKPYRNDASVAFYDNDAAAIRKGIEWFDLECGKYVAGDQ